MKKFSEICGFIIGVIFSTFLLFTTSFYEGKGIEMGLFLSNLFDASYCISAFLLMPPLLIFGAFPSFSPYIYVGLYWGLIGSLFGYLSKLRKAKVLIFFSVLILIAIHTVFLFIIYI